MNLDLSAIVLAPRGLDGVRGLLKSLAAQTAASRIEIVFVAPPGFSAANDPVLAGVGGHRAVEFEGFDSSAAARAAGVMAAQAPVVAFTEDHCFPEPGWAEALIDAHRAAWAGVGPVFQNANPATAVSWANLVIEYGEWLDPTHPGERSHIPGHNSAYKRSVLAALGGRLGPRLAHESVLQWELRAAGERFCLDPRARTRHQNFSRLLPSLQLRVLHARVFGAARVRSFPLGLRWLFAAGAPLIPAIRFARCVRHLRRACPAPTWTVAPTLMLLLAAEGLGELLGYAAGEGSAMARLSALEVGRERYLVAGDLEADGAGSTRVPPTTSNGPAGVASSR